MAASGTAERAEYLKRYPGADERVRRRGGDGTHMPNLPLTGTQVDQLIAFLRYTSAMDTEGWPPKPQVDGLQSPLARPLPGVATARSEERRGGNAGVRTCKTRGAP